jgi:aspartyl-tRNA(Asn)/glutamyl-tRNA(Gln) amidotransferase subunit C
VAAPPDFGANDVTMSEGIDIRYVAHLARLQLSDAEVERFGAQLGEILDYVEKLKAVDVAGIEPMAHAYPASNVFREDAAAERENAAGALANAPRQAQGLFVVPKVVE